VEWCEFDGVLGGSFYRPEKGGERVQTWARIRVSRPGLVATVAKARRGLLCGTVVMLETRWRSRVMRARARSSGHMN
jgi:hypothetical protein